MVAQGSNKLDIVTPNHRLHAPTSDPVYLDSGCNGHYLRPSKNWGPVCPCSPPLYVRLPTGAHMRSCGTVALPITASLPLSVLADIFPEMDAFSLLSVGKLCDAGCFVRFTEHNATVLRGGSVVVDGDLVVLRGCSVILRGTRNQVTRL